LCKGWDDKDVRARADHIAFIHRQLAFSNVGDSENCEVNESTQGEYEDENHVPKEDQEQLQQNNFYVHFKHQPRTCLKSHANQTPLRVNDISFVKRQPIFSGVGDSQHFEVDDPTEDEHR